MSGVEMRRSQTAEQAGQNEMQNKSQNTRAMSGIEMLRTWSKSRDETQKGATIEQFEAVGRGKLGRLQITEEASHHKSFWKKILYKMGFYLEFLFGMVM